MRLGLAGAVLGAASLWLAQSASAHVTVAAPGVTVGATDAQITFRAPNESESADTIELKVQMPLDHPIAGVLVAPKAGWTSTITQSKLTTPITTDDGTLTEVVSEIDWKADAGAGIAPGYFGEFDIIGGSLPDGVSTLTFKAIQTYSDGTVVNWTEEAAPGSNAVPDHPAPTLTLAAATASDATAKSSTTGASRAAATTGIALGSVGVALAIVALGFVAIAGRRRARPASDTE